MPPITISPLLPELTGAELAYARCNAARTCVADCAGIAVKAFEIGRGIVDPSRPDNPYYNRVVPEKGAGRNLDPGSIPDSIKAVELTPPFQTPANESGLSAAGFSRGYDLCYLVSQPLKPVPVAADVRRLGPDQTDVFFDLLELSGVAFPQETRAAKKGSYCNDRFRCFVSFSPEGNPTGWATSYVEGGSAFLGNAFTIPEYRCRGYHEALLHVRYNDAHELGLRNVFTDVEPDSPSQRNCERAGFQRLSQNTVWIRE